MKFTAAIYLPLLATLTTAIPTTNTTHFEEVALIPADFSAAAAPAGIPNHKSKRNTGWAGIYYCRSTDWRAPCAHTWLKVGQCMNFAGGWDNNVQSFGPDPGPHYCVLHSEPDCGGAEPTFRIRHPGSRNTEEFGQKHRASSVRCSY
ncbi:short chain dehydrogenase [Diplodia corticola]|uniref:Short chain dehydrogenase n=1 Tax=Diplodia corticola TaxID=236234 RepID=A0A1J9RAF6_9PEZI|nr:short chain dehydrogenase [Diplodia corticola]OJD29403.1 short chain dehydrogenase [Diplodia corticola]